MLLKFILGFAEEYFADKDPKTRPYKINFDQKSQKEKSQALLLCLLKINSHASLKALKKS
jgi:hypothetical protein